MFIKEPVLGMRDILPKEMEIREYLLKKLKQTYLSFGYSLIETPCLEHLANLTNKQGGENEKLIFKVLKRGEKLAAAMGSGLADDLADSALRYDLTVPLARYYANNADKLPLPFKALQIGSAWRADRPQKGRFRQFTQCDIDILGDPTNNAEIELIYVTSLLLESVGVQGCTVMLNDRRLLRAMAQKSGFAEEDFSKVFIILDKYDKIGLEGVERELSKSNYPPKSVAAYVNAFQEILQAEDRFACCLSSLGDYLEAGVIENLKEIADNVNLLSDFRFKLDFDPSLVRGMSYYTGVIFEIKSEDFRGVSLAGGGRYDEMTGKYLGQEISACGFSIGFERMINALLERDEPPSAEEKLCVLYDKSFLSQDVARLQKKCDQARAEGRIILLQRMKKNLKNQIKMLEEDYYSSFLKVRSPEEIDELDL